MPRGSASKKTVLAGEQDRPDVARRREQWKKYQTRIAPERLVFIDETWTKTNMAPLRGWAPRGQRLRAKVPYGHWKTMTFLAAPRHDRIDAPWVLDGPINGESFRIYVEKVLVPTLQSGELVVMDNLACHKKKAIRQAIRSAGARLFLLPKYSPDLNPIEQVFAKLKHLLRKAEARTVDAVSPCIGKLLEAFTQQECTNYFKNAGYDLT
jgi:putative transposase